MTKKKKKACLSQWRLTLRLCFLPEMKVKVHTEREVGHHPYIK